MEKTSKYAIFAVFLALAAVLPLSFASAQITDYEYTPLTTIPGITEAGKTITNPAGMLGNIYALAIGIGSVLAVVMIVYSGFLYMYQESIDGKSNARNQIIGAFSGLLLILTSWIILRTINADLVNIDFVLPRGSGGLSSLVAKETEIQNLRSALAKAAEDSANRGRSIDQTEAVVAAKAAEVKASEDKLALLRSQPSTQATRDAIAAEEAKLAAARTDFVKAEEILKAKKVENYTARDNDMIEKQRDYLFSNEVLLAQKKVEDDQSAGLKAARDSLAILSSRTQSQLDTLAKSVTEVDGFTVQGDTLESEASYKLKTQQNVAYLSLSKTLVDKASENLQSSTGSIDARSAAIDSLNAEYQGKIQGLKESGRQDLADQLSQDLEKTNTLLKIGWKYSCSTKSKVQQQALTLCKE